MSCIFLFELFLYVHYHLFCFFYSLVLNLIQLMNDSLQMTQLFCQLIPQCPRCCCRRVWSLAWAHTVQHHAFLSPVMCQRGMAMSCNARHEILNEISRSVVGMIYSVISHVFNGQSPNSHPAIQGAARKTAGMAELSSIKESWSSIIFKYMCNLTCCIKKHLDVDGMNWHKSLPTHAI